MQSPAQHITPQSAETKSMPIRGQVVYMYAFDVAYELRRYPHAELLGRPVATFSVDGSKRSPRQLFFHRPQMVHLPAVEKLSRDGTVRLRTTVKLLPVGAISVSIRVDFDVPDLIDLAAYHDLRFSDGRTIHDEARAVAEQVRLEMIPHAVRPHPSLRDEEAYTVFCVQTPGPAFNAEQWLDLHRRPVAAALTEEPDPTLLSQQECQESTHQSFSYSRQDLCVIDWDAALLVDDPTQFDQTLYVMELANVQLTELEAYDSLLDEVVDRVYGDLSSGSMWRWGGRFTQRELRVIRVDLARLADEMGNIGKFFGDYHAGRLYQAMAARFHLADWQRAIDHKMQTLDHLYQLMQSDRTNLWMIILESTIVFLILFDIIKAMIS
jgi:hypothetical protein